MSGYRIAWQKTGDPQRLTATVPEGGAAELWFHSGAQGTRGWHWRVRVGQAVEAGIGTDRQHASDEANQMLPGVLAKERARLAKIAAKEQLEADLTAARDAGSVDVMAFGLGSSDYDRLVHMLDFLRKKGWLEGSLKPLAQAASQELYRRRTGQR